MLIKTNSYLVYVWYTHFFLYKNKLYKNNYNPGNKLMTKRQKLRESSIS